MKKLQEGVRKARSGFIGNRGVRDDKAGWGLQDSLRISEFKKEPIEMHDEEYYYPYLVHSHTGYPRSYASFPIHMPARYKKTDSKIDAIYIPTNFRRPKFAANIDMLQEAARHVYIIPSKPGAVPNDYSSYKSITILNVDIPKLHRQFLKLSSSLNPCLDVCSDYDLPMKRNFAIHHARAHGFKYVMLLDDDIEISSHSISRAFSHLNNGIGIVGFYVLQYADVSAIDHLHRMIVKRSSPVSVGGNCIIFNTETVSGFFPYIYNEDWLFIYCANHNVSSRAAGFARQLPHSPWLNIERVKFEQFGEALAQGIKINQRKKRNALDGDRLFWDRAYAKYCARLSSLLSFNCLTIEQREAVNAAVVECQRFSGKQLHTFANTYLTELRSITYGHRILSFASEF